MSKNYDKDDDRRRDQYDENRDADNAGYIEKDYEGGGEARNNDAKGDEPDDSQDVVVSRRERKRRAALKANAEMDANEDKSGKKAREGEIPRKTASARKRKSVNYRKAAPRNARKGGWLSGTFTAVMAIALFAVIVFSAGAFVRSANFDAKAEAIMDERFYPGISIDGVDVSNMTLEQALERWAEIDERNRAECNITLHVDEHTWVLTPDTMSYSSDYETIIRQAWDVGRYGTFSRRTLTIEKTAGAWKHNFETTSGFDEDALTQTMEAIALEVSEPAVDATIAGFDEIDGFTFSASKSGMIVDPHDLFDAVSQAYESGQDEVTLNRHVVEPTNTINSLRGRFGLIATTTTSASSSSSNRLNNLNIACKTINGLRVDPGETFSFNETLGKRTRAKGYKGAPALSSGTHTSQVGGGICQVSTTLFNSVAKADMEIVMRYPHSIPSTYIARGLDATVNWPNQDFRFKNTSDYPIYISARLTGSKQVVVSVYGKLLDDGVTIKLKSRTVDSTPPGDPTYTYTNEIPTGQRRWAEERRTGYRVITYKFYYDASGNEIKREELFKSVYASSGGVVEIGR
ncbi:MAG: VanW family protein [Clostridia bacterium]|nr:VanW family protein [Clostridia bacterium]